jgi:hypothetical protein
LVRASLVYDLEFKIMSGKDDWSEERELSYFQLHYDDMVARISEGKQAAWKVVQWTFTLLGAVAGIYLTQEANIRRDLWVFWTVEVIVLAIGVTGVVLLHVLLAEIDAHRWCLRQMRERVGGWVHTVFDRLPLKVRANGRIQSILVGAGAGMLALALGVIHARG